MIRLPFIPLLLVSIISGCSSGAPPAPENTENLAKPTGLDLFFSRASADRTEFEQYKVMGDKLFFECGRIRGGRNLPQSQGLRPLPQEFASNILQSAHDYLEYAAARNPQLSEPGRSSTMFDPGQFFLSVEAAGKTKEVKTSLDYVSNPAGEAAVKLRRLALQLRESAGGSICGNKTFYGL